MLMFETIISGHNNCSSVISYKRMNYGINKSYEMFYGHTFFFVGF